MKNEKLPVLYPYYSGYRGNTYLCKHNGSKSFPNIKIKMIRDDDNNSIYKYVETGKIHDGPVAFVSEGKFEYDGEDLVITELPVEETPETYKKKTLEKWMDEGACSTIEDNTLADFVSYRLTKWKGVPVEVKSKSKTKKVEEDSDDEEIVKTTTKGKSKYRYEEATLSNLNLIRANKISNMTFLDGNDILVLNGDYDNIMNIYFDKSYRYHNLHT